MPQKQYHLTLEGVTKLQKELEHLKTVRRPEVAEKIQRAIERGSTDHNAEYEDAKNEQAFVEGRILTLETMLKNVVIIQSDKADYVKLGSTVKVMTQDSKPDQFIIVGSAEANPSQGKISYHSPVGQALLNKKVGAKVTVKAPGGDLRFLITHIE